MNTRIEIYKDELWQPLKLKEGTAIKYNNLINKVGKIATREISHTNTFSLPRLQQNLHTLGLNIFNPNDLARAMNAKYIAKYYVEDKLLQQGFLVINNTNGGDIKVNFIEESLSLIQKWGSTSLQQLLQDQILEFPADYATAITALREFDLDKNAVITPLGAVGTRGYNLCLFPNNLNAIGDNFQISENDIRLVDSFNPYQSRPVWNAKALFDLATESYGYTPIYDDSVDWDVVEDTYIINDGGNQNGKGESGLQNLIHPRVFVNNPYYTRLDTSSANFTYEVRTVFNFPTTVSIKPNDIPNWVDPTGLEQYQPWDPSVPGPWMSEQSVFIPDTTEGSAGTMQFIADHAQSTILEYQYDVFNIWKNATPGGDVIIDTVSLDSAGLLTPPADFTIGTTYEIDLTIDKDYYNTIPAGADTLIGVMVSYTDLAAQSSLGQLYNMTVVENYLPEGVIAFDEHGQILPDEVDLSLLAPTKSIKTLLSSLMHKEGILMSVDNINKEVKFFNYGEYEAQRLDSEFGNWSEYLLKYNPIVHNTDYGNEFGKINKVGLSSPFKGNIFSVSLENQGEDSKYKEVANNFVSGFKDIENVAEVANLVNPYFEYTNTGLGLVEYAGTISGTLAQVRADESTQGNFNGLSKLANVNYAQLPSGVKYWYTLVDQAIRVDAQFLIPVNIIKNLDISRPIYIEELGGFYIIEEIRGYTNGSSPVTVKLIKLIEDFRGLTDQTQTLTPEVVLTASTWSPGIVFSNYGISASSSYVNFTPTTANITFKKMTDSPDDGGTLTGAVVTQSVTLTSPYSNIINGLASSTPMTTAEEGWYEVEVIASDSGGTSYTSNKVYKELGAITVIVVPPSVSCVVSTMSTGYGVPSGSAPVFFTYNGHTPTSSVFSYQKWDNINDVAIGSIRTLTFPLSGTGGVNYGTVQVAFLDGAGFYKMNITTNEATSPDSFYGGYIII